MQLAARVWLGYKPQVSPALPAALNTRTLAGKAMLKIKDEAQEHECNDVMPND